MSKSICIKTNNHIAIQYIINELQTLSIDNIYFSHRNFKNYNNIIIHYNGKAIYLFLSSISKILAYMILDLFENEIVRKIISSEYFYFSIEEQKNIFNLCIDALNYDESIDRFEIIENSFYTFFSENKSLNLRGFIDFRLYDYIKYLDSIIDICVNKYIIDKEYMEYVNVLKEYIKKSQSLSKEIHLIYQNGESILLDENKKIIPVNKNAFNLRFLSDISFSSNDYALNNLLTMLPKKLFIHLLDEDDEFINTLKLVFDSRVKICTNCNVCNLYKNSNLHNTIH